MFYTMLAEGQEFSPTYRFANMNISAIHSDISHGGTREPLL